VQVGDGVEFAHVLMWRGIRSGSGADSTRAVLFNLHTGKD